MYCVQKAGEVFSQHISTGRSWIHAHTGEAEVKGMCRYWLYVGGRVLEASVCLIQSPGHLFFRLQTRGGFWAGTRASCDNWPERKGGNCSLESAVEN